MSHHWLNITGMVEYETSIVCSENILAISHTMPAKLIELVWKMHHTCERNRYDDITIWWTDHYVAWWPVITHGMVNRSYLVRSKASQQAGTAVNVAVA